METPTAPIRPPLDHGARRIRGAEPFKVDVVDQSVRWSCTHCRRSVALRDSWAVEVEGRDGALRFVVCPQCAASFALPPAMVVDLVRLRGAEPTAVALRGLLERVEAIVHIRGDIGDRVPVRATDVRAFAAEHGIAPAALARFLEAEGIASPA